MFVSVVKVMWMWEEVGVTERALKSSRPHNFDEEVLKSFGWLVRTQKDRCKAFSRPPMLHRLQLLSLCSSHHINKSSPLVGGNYWWHMYRFPRSFTRD